MTDETVETTEEAMTEAPAEEV
ncbi:MAG: hypothetical protein QOK45_2198, partial [Mycobacterium sp.]|nr:hypothetical protein [Mycobacterium sp.]